LDMQTIFTGLFLGTFIFFWLKMCIRCIKRIKQLDQKKTGSRGSVIQDLKADHRSVTFYGLSQKGKEIALCHLQADKHKQYRLCWQEGGFFEKETHYERFYICQTDRVNGIESEYGPYYLPQNLRYKLSTVPFLH